MKGKNSSLPIGVFDSGIGGIAVMGYLKSKLPNESFIYLGDNNNAPYGNKDVNELKKLVTTSLGYMFEKGVKAIVIACNTVSTTLGNYIKNRYGVPVILTLPTVVENGYLLCTPLTAKSDYVKCAFNGKVLPLPFLAGEIERFIFNKDKINLNCDLKGLPNGDYSVVLGCTHYLYLKEEIKDITGKVVVDGLNDIENNLVTALSIVSGFNDTVSGKVEFIGQSKLKNEKVYKTYFS